LVGLDVSHGSMDVMNPLLIIYALSSRSMQEKKYLRQFSVSINLECGSVEILFDFKFNFIHAYDDIKTYLILMSLTYNDLELLLFNYMLLIMVVVKQ
jgi:hypothetical protein